MIQLKNRYDDVQAVKRPLGKINDFGNRRVLGDISNNINRNIEVQGGEVKKARLIVPQSTRQSSLSTLENNENNQITGRSSISDIHSNLSGTTIQPSFLQKEKEELHKQVANLTLQEKETETYDDPQLVTEYVHDIYRYLREAEKKRMPSANYMKRQTDINTKMRAILVDWLVEVHRKFQLFPEVLFLAVNYIDRFLDKKVVARNSLQLVGCGAMFVAAKFEEMLAPIANDFVCITAKAYSREQILAMESVVLNTLHFNLSVPTVFTFLQRYPKLANCTEREIHLCYFFSELCLVEYHMLQYLPSAIAASVVYITRKITGQVPWPHSLASQIDYTEELLMPCIHDIEHIIFNQNPREHAVRNKYSSSKRMRVAKMDFSMLLR